MLWVGTVRGGLWRARVGSSPTRGDFTRFDAVPASATVQCIFEDAAGNLWISGANTPLTRITPDRTTLCEYRNNPRDTASISSDVVLCAAQSLDAAYVDEYVALVSQTTGAPLAALDTYKGMMVGSVLGEGQIAKVLPEWAARQAYIALGQLMLSAALLGVDACPMEGFVPDALNAELGLAARGLRAAVLCPVGYRAPEDKYAAAHKVRWPADRVIEHLA